MLLCQSAIPSDLRARARIRAEIIPGTLTALQDWCDRSAPLGAELPSLTSEFYEYDVRFPIFCTKAGSLPGLRTRLTSEVPSMLAERSQGVWTPDSVLNRPVEHADGSRSWCGMDEARIFKLPEKVFRYDDFVSTVPTLRAQLVRRKDTVPPSLDDPFRQVTGLAPFTAMLLQLRMNAGYKRGSRACVHAIGGNLATRAPAGAWALLPMHGWGVRQSGRQRKRRPQRHASPK